MTDGEAPAFDQKIMEPVGEQTNVQIAFAAVLAARRESFLAHYPRWLKLASAVLILCALVGSVYFVISLIPRAAPPPEDLHKLVKEEEAQVDLALGQQENLAPDSIVQLKTEAEKEAAKSNDNRLAEPPLTLAPDPELVEESPYGTLPRISKDGRKPWQVYSRPFDFRDPRPRVSIVISDLGFSRLSTNATITQMPPSVTLSFDVQAPSIKEWLDRARNDGHETLIAVPMEPFDYPGNDPGPNTLLTSLPNSDNVQRLISALRMGVGYVGITTLSGSRFTTDATKVAPVLDEIKNRGLMVLDANIASHSVIESISHELQIPVAVNVRTIDSDPMPSSIDQALLDLEKTARVRGSAVGVASPLPVTLERIEKWSQTLADRGIVLAPLSAVAK